jgi:FtsP/CotA-like multicopper oxidase with cupredoxin domain
MGMNLTRRGLIAGTAALFVARPSFAQQPLLLRAADGELPLHDVALKTPAFNELGAGPLLELKRGEAFSLNVENALDFEFHFRPQGLRGKSVQGADTPVKPGETRAITITPLDAGTFVYRAGGEGGMNAPRTLLLAGPLIVSADQPRIADREALLAVNTLVIPDSEGSGTLRRVATVNGGRGITLAARPEERLRLRLVNLAQEAVNGVRLPKGTRVAAIDGQPCDPFPPFDNVMFLPPLGRADILFDIPKDAAAPLVITDALDTTQTLVTVSPEGEVMTERYLAATLPDNHRLPKEIPLESAERAVWKPAETANDPLIRVKSGGSAVLTFENNATPHALTVEGHTARLLDALDDGWKPWWNDTLLVHPNETARLAFVAEMPGRYALDMIPLEGNGAPTRAWIEVT